MNKIIMLPALVIILLIFSGCSSKNDSAGGGTAMVEPGDKIGNFTVTTGEQGKFTYGFNVTCSELSAQNSYSCNVAVGEIVNVSTGVYDSTGKGNLDQVWAHSNYQMFIDNRPVDLPAFGTIDYVHPQVGTIRFANVVITANQPGEITVKDSGLYDNGDPFSSSSTYVFSKP